MMERRWLRWIGLAAALAILDVSLTFHNIWPTPFIRWTGELSVELAACILMLVLATRSIGAPSRTRLAGLSVLWILLVIGRYAEVTAPALFGRDINLYWELQYIPAVIALLAQAAPVWLIVVAVSVTLATLGALYALARWALGRIASETSVPRGRLALTVVAVAAIALFVGSFVIFNVFSWICLESVCLRRSLIFIILGSVLVVSRRRFGRTAITGRRMPRQKWNLL